MLIGKNGTVGHYKVIATSCTISNNLQRVADKVKEEFGLTLDITNGTTSDPETFLSIENVPFLG